jgi:hypothetical protein
MQVTKVILIFSLLIFLNVKCFGTTWSPAYPYTQKIEGQKVVIKAFPYAPYSGSPMIGLTKVFFGKKLLYTIDQYYREKIFTSPDGHYLVILHTSNFVGVTSYVTFGEEHADFNKPAIEIFKDGKPFKTFALKDVIDTAKLISNGLFFDWGYKVNLESFSSAESGCQSCKEVYGKKILKTCDTSEIDLDACEVCRRECDSVKLKEFQTKLFRNSAYVLNNDLFIITNQKKIVKLDFESLKIEHIRFDEGTLDKNSFNPPKLKRKYKKIKLPDKFDEPYLKDGTKLEKGIANFFNLQAGKKGERTFCIFIDFLLTHNGRCLDVYSSVYDRRISDSFSEESINKEMAEKLNLWMKEQIFQTKLIPKGFDKFSFLSMIDLK